MLSRVWRSREGGASTGRSISVAAADREMVAVLERDTDLARRVPANLQASAARRLVAPTITARPGIFRPEQRRPQEQSGLGVLVLRGLMLRETEVGDERTADLFGPGDLVPPASGGGDPLVEKVVVWRALTDTQLAWLDGGFARAAAPFEGVVEEIVERAFRHDEWAAVQRTLAAQPAADGRILLLFGHLADRWGRRDDGGVLVPMALSHRALAVLVGAQRPTVATVLKHLAEDQIVVRVASGEWLLTGRGIEAVATRSRETSVRPPIGTQGAP